MGSAFSIDDEEPSEDRENLQRRQRAQILLLSQLREQAQAGGEEMLFNIPPTEQPSMRSTQVFKNPLHVRGKSVQLSCSTAAGEQTWQLSFIFDALVECEVLVHIGLGCGVEIRQPMMPGGDSPDVVVAWSPPGEGGVGNSRWVSTPASFREGLNQEFRGEVDLCEFTQKDNNLADKQEITDEEEPSTSTTPRGRPRMRQQGFCIELKAATKMAANAGQPGSAEWTTGRFVRKGAVFGSEESGTEVVEAKILAQSVKLPEAGLAPCYSMYEVYGADTAESGDATVLGQDCVICMVEPRDTAVLPCRHMCVCGQCADEMRRRVQFRSYRCPICREKVASLLQIRQDDAS